MEFSSNGKGNLGVTLGAIGTGLGILNGGLGLMGAGNNGCCNGGYNYNYGGCCSDDRPITRYEARMMNDLSEKDSEIALLKADKYTDQKITEAYRDLVRQIGAVDDKVAANREEQNTVNMQQAVYNGTNTATISCLQEQVRVLQGLTKTVIPNDSICPGWGPVICEPTLVKAPTK